MKIIVDTIIMFIGTIIFVVLMNKYVLTQKNIKKIKSIKDKYNVLTNVLFIIIGTIASMFGSPTSPINIISYYLYNPITAILISLLIHITGAVGSYVLIKSINPKFIIDKLKQIKIFKEFVKLRKVSDIKWLEISTLLRLVPTFPYALISYLLSLTSIPFVIYLISTIIGSIVYMGSEMYMIHNSRKLSESSNKSKYIILLVITIVSIVGVDRIVSNILKTQKEQLLKKQ